MAHCTNCGEKLPENAYFCPNCGTKTVLGAEKKAQTPADEFRDAFLQAGVELERALSIAARETHKAFKKATSDIQKSAKKEPLVCPNCKTKNPPNSVFCSNCGTKLQT